MNEDEELRFKCVELASRSPASTLKAYDASQIVDEGRKLYNFVKDRLLAED